MVKRITYVCQKKPKLILIGITFISVKYNLILQRITSVTVEYNIILKRITCITEFDE